MWRPQLSEFLASVDWPNLLAGAIVTLGCGGISWLISVLYGRYVSARDLPYKIWGPWFSAEFDPKTTEQTQGNEIQMAGHNTFLRVRVRRRLGRGVVIKALGPVAELPHDVPTRWIVRGQLVHGDTLVGTWRSTVPDTNRHGTAMLKFLDHGRAVGYWTGPARDGHPIHGYWIMCRQLEDLKGLANESLTRTQFKIIDVASFIKQCPPPAASAPR